MNLNQVTVAVTDVPRAIAFYQCLGLKLIVENLPDYARFVCPDGQASFSLSHEAQVVPGSTLVYFECGELDAEVARLQAEGLSFELLPDHVLMVNGARWPFIDGTLELLPTRMALGVPETRRYTLRVTGINAAKFVERLELGNIAARGTFDGELPLVFDENGG